MAGVWLARDIIGVRCEPSPAHEVHCSVPGVDVGMPGTSMVTVSGAAPPPLSWVARKNAGAPDESGASSVLRQHPAGGVEVAALQAGPLRNELSR